MYIMIVIESKLYIPWAILVLANSLVGSDKSPPVLLNSIVTEPSFSKTTTFFTLTCGTKKKKSYFDDIV